MKPLFAVALSLCLTPAFAQYAPPPPPPDAQQSPEVQQSPQAQPAPAPPSAAAPNSAPRPERRRLERPTGITPRTDSAAYPVSRQLSQFSIGAQLLSTKELERKLSTPLGKRYVVVEVGVFPAGSQHVNFRPTDFTLRVGSENQDSSPPLPRTLPPTSPACRRGLASVPPWVSELVLGVPPSASGSEPIRILHGRYA